MTAAFSCDTDSTVDSDLSVSPASSEASLETTVSGVSVSSIFDETRRVEAYNIVGLGLDSTDLKAVEDALERSPAPRHASSASNLIPVTESCTHECQEALLKKVKTWNCAVPLVLPVSFSSDWQPVVHVCRAKRLVFDLSAEGWHIDRVALQDMPAGNKLFQSTALGAAQEEVPAVTEHNVPGYETTSMDLSTVRTMLMHGLTKCTTDHVESLTAYVDGRIPVVYDGWIAANSPADQQPIEFTPPREVSRQETSRTFTFLPS